MSEPLPFRKLLRERFEDYVQEQSGRFPEGEVLLIDAHCHDLNSDTPDEVVGRLLRSRETWLPTEELFAQLHRRGMDVLTVTNHNNARSCWEWLDTGAEVMPAAEFTCFEPEYEVWIHVLTYGFTREQEPVLQVLRHNLYEFLTYCCDHRIPTVWAHPLYNYGKHFTPPLEFYEKLTLTFFRFEVLNGHRDAWQNLLWNSWLDSLTPEKLDELSKKHGIPLDRFSHRPYQKVATGGSDCHMGLFVGTAGTRLHVPNLKSRLQTSSPISLATEALWEGRTAPFGRYSDEQRISAAFLDYYCQAQMHLEDAGLVRLLLHRGSSQQKLAAFLVGNLIQELRRHKYTTRFFKTAHRAIHGTPPSLITRQLALREVRPVINQLTKISDSRHGDIERYERELMKGIPQIFSTFSKLFAERLEKKVTGEELTLQGPDQFMEFFERLEIPIHFRGWSSGRRQSGAGRSLAEFIDGLPLPAFGALLIGAASFSSARVMFKSRHMLNSFAEQIGEFKPPARGLWLTDTLFDRNGVSRSLGLKHQESVRRGLALDFLTAHPKEKSGEHLTVLKPLLEKTLSIYPDQPFRLPDLLEVQRTFVEGSYDRVICSTELFMGPVAVYLKHAFSVPAYFFLHTDWMSFAEDTLDFSTQQLDRLRRFLRLLYQQFDGIFVLNSQQKEWLASPSMGIPEERIHLTAHWADTCFQPIAQLPAGLIPGDWENAPVLMYSGRLSREKGIFELPELLERARSVHPQTKLIIAGSGPDDRALADALPEGVLFTGWVSKEELAFFLNRADVFVLPSRFDTFSCSLLEAQRCGAPAVAYNVMGPREIVQSGETGFLVETVDQMAEAICLLLQDESLRLGFASAAIISSEKFAAESVMDGFLEKTGIIAQGEQEEDSLKYEPIPDGPVGASTSAAL